MVGPFNIIIIIACFIGILILPYFSKTNRALVALVGVLIIFFTFLVSGELNLSITLFQIIFTSRFFYVGFHSIIFILGMLFIIQICGSAGIFRFAAFKLAQRTKGRPTLLFLVFSSMAVFISALLNNITCVIILIPLTVVVSRILGIDPSPYIISEAILANVGAVIFSISSIPNILISTYAGMTFNEFFIYVGLFSLFLFGITTIFFLFSYRKKLTPPKEIMLENLQAYNAWNYVPNKGVFYRSIIILISILICFVAIPSNIISPDLIAICGAMILVISSRFKAKEIIEKIDFELLLYLMGIFIITGAMQYAGILDLIGNGISVLCGQNEVAVIILVLWVSSFLSTSVDNLPITQVFTPIVGDLITTEHMAGKSIYCGLVYGVNLGNNLILKTKNVSALNIASENARPIKKSDFLKLSFIATILQLVAISVYFIMIYDFILGLIILSIIAMVLVFLITIIQLKHRRQSIKNG